MTFYYVKNTHFEVWDNLDSTFSQNVTIKGNSLIFDYACGNETICSPYFLVLPKGKFQLEVWGAQGGFNLQKNVPAKGGGYSKGILINRRATLAYIFVGGKGQESKGGYNGGGSVISPTRIGGGGGGATDIRIGGETLYHRILVAGELGERNGGLKRMDMEVA